MAVIHHAARVSDAAVRKQACFLILMALTLGGTMTVTGGTGGAERLSMIGITGVIVVFFSFVAMKKNPLVWLKLFRPTRYRRVMAHKDDLMAYFSQLDDDSHVFHWVYLEFFKVDFLVISPHGIVVIRVLTPEDLEQLPEGSDGAAQGLALPDREKRLLWKICHFLNILIHKGYKQQIMPVPMAVLVDAGPGPLSPGGDIDVVTARSMVEVIRKYPQKLEPGLVHGFAGFVRERYTA